jgi:hypothetical protein
VIAPGWNVLVYALAGDDAMHANITHAIGRMHAALNTDQCNVVVQVHARSRTTRHWISTGHDVRTEVLPTVEDASEASTLTRFLNATDHSLPDRSTALVLWAHSTGLDHVHDHARKAAGGHPGLGGGVDEVVDRAPARGYDPARSYDPAIGHGWRDQPSRQRPERYGCRWGPDPNTHRFLTNIAMKRAIAASTRHRVDVLGLNACWMASLEVEYELRSICDVQVAAQVDAQPCPYGEIITALAAAPRQSAEQLATAIVASVQSEITKGNRGDAVSALRSGAALDALATAFDAYAKRVTALIDSDWEAVSRAVMEDAQRVDDPYLVDLMSLTRVLGKHDVKAKIAAAAVASKFHAMRLASAASAAHPHLHGLSVFCPKSTLVDLADAYSGTEFRTNSWATFLLKFQQRLAVASATPAAAATGA